MSNRCKRCEGTGKVGLSRKAGGFGIKTCYDCKGSGIKPKDVKIPERPDKDDFIHDADMYIVDLNDYTDGLEKRVNELVEYTHHTELCELSDNTLEMDKRKNLGYIPECSCELDNLLNPKNE